jgi:ABC-type bacteriocin/lantibiotic exporter with double-glycine peptidase domain
MSNKIKGAASTFSSSRVRLHSLIEKAWQSPKESLFGGYESFFVRDFSNQKLLSSRNFMLGYWYNFFPKFILETIVVSGFLIFAIAVTQFFNSSEMFTLLGLLGLAVFRILPAVIRLQSSNNQLMNALEVSADSIALQSVLEKANEKSKDILQKCLVRGYRHLDSHSELISFKGVTFNHLNDDSAVFEEINLKIPKLGLHFVTGESGVGKSTFFDLVLGFHTPSLGTIEVMGVPSELVSIYLGGDIAYVPQDPYLENLTALQFLNLGTGVTSYSVGAIREVFNDVGFDFVNSGLRGDLSSRIGENGNNLSGGEKQKLVLARAMLRTPSILLLDEAMSAVDKDSYTTIMTYLKKYSQNATVFVISHDLQTFSYADWLIQIKDKKISVLQNLN